MQMLSNWSPLLMASRNSCSPFGKQIINAKWPLSPEIHRDSYSQDRLPRGSCCLLVDFLIRQDAAGSDGCSRRSLHHLFARLPVCLDPKASGGTCWRVPWRRR